MIILIFNLFIFFILLSIRIRQDKCFNVNVFILLYYSFFAVTAILAFNTDVYQWHTLQRIDIRFAPYIFFHICFAIFIFPIWRINSNKLRPDIKEYQANLIFYIAVMSFSISILLNFQDALNTSNMLEIYEQEITRSGIKAWASNFANIFSIPSNILAFYYLSIKKKKIGRSLLLLSLILIEGYCNMRIGASRGIAFFLFGDVFISFILFSSLLGKKIKRIITFVIIVFLTIFIPIILTISADRFGNDGIKDWILSYFSEPFINWGTIFWDSPGFLEGKFTFKKLFNLELPNVTTPTYLFKTFVGALYIDFNIIGTLLFLSFYAIIASFLLRKVRPGKIAFRDIMLYFIIIKITYAGIFGFQIFNYYNYIGWIFIYFVLLGKKRIQIN